MAIQQKICAYCIVCIVALLLSCSGSIAQTTTAKKAAFVFRVPYGKELNKIGVQWADKFEGGAPYNESACGITVLPDGDITIGDFVQGKIKRFSPKGQLLGVTEGWAGVVSSYSTDSDGNVYVSAELSVVKYSKDGHLLWKKEEIELVPNSEYIKTEKEMNCKIDRTFGGLVDVSKEGWVIINMGAKVVNDKFSREIGVVLDDNGKFIKFLPYFPRVSGNLFWTFKIENNVKNDNEPPGPTTINLFSEKGTLIKEFKLDLTCDNGIHYKQRLGEGGVNIFADNKDNIWVKCRAILDKPIEIKKGVTINREYLLNKYDINGAFLEELRLPYSPFMSDANFTVADDGTLYYMQFDKDGINVMAYK